MADAIARTLWRLGVSRRHLLEWAPAAQATAGPRLDAMGFGRRMAGGVALGAGALVGVWALGSGSWPLALPFAALWIASPLVASLISRSSNARSHLAPSEADAAALRATARRTWRFFETFVTPLENHLPPDNFQEDPKPEIAPPDVADQYRPLSLVRRQRARLRLDRNRAGDRSPGGDPRHDGPVATPERALLQLVRHALARAAQSRCMSPPSIAAIWRDISSRSRTPAANGARAPPSLDRRLDGIADALEITSAETARLRRAGDHTQTVTLSQISDAIAMARQALQLARLARRRSAGTACGRFRAKSKS